MTKIIFQKFQLPYVAVKYILMRRYLYIISALLFLNAATELHQFSGLPFLLQHYRHHKMDNPSISVISFLKLHYSDTHPGDNDGSEDNQLPFKSMINLIHTDIPIVNKEVKLDPAYPKNIDKPASSYSEDIPNSPAFSIFHPPRFA